MTRWRQGGDVVAKFRKLRSQEWLGWGGGSKDPEDWGRTDASVADHRTPENAQIAISAHPSPHRTITAIARAVQTQVAAFDPERAKRRNLNQWPSGSTELLGAET